MLENLYELTKEIKMALVWLDVRFDLSDKELKRINKMCEVLAPIRLQKAEDLLIPEKIIAFTLTRLGELVRN